MIRHAAPFVFALGKRGDAKSCFLCFSKRIVPNLVALHSRSGFSGRAVAPVLYVLHAPPALSLSGTSGDLEVRYAPDRRSGSGAWYANACLVCHRGRGATIMIMGGGIPTSLRSNGGAVVFGGPSRALVWLPSESLDRAGSAARGVLALSASRGGRPSARWEVRLRALHSRGRGAAREAGSSRLSPPRRPRTRSTTMSPCQRAYLDSVRRGACPYARLQDRKRRSAGELPRRGAQRRPRRHGGDGLS
jgi:hypothetical protein